MVVTGGAEFSTQKKIKKYLTDCKNLAILIIESEVRKMNKEKLIEQIMKEMAEDGEPVTREEAEEMAKMEIKAKGIKNYTQSTVEKKPKKTRERKIDEEKAKILEFAKKGLTLMMNSATITVENETKLHFNYNGTEYTLNLIKHRPPKKQWKGLDSPPQM